MDKICCRLIEKTPQMDNICGVSILNSFSAPVTARLLRRTVRPAQQGKKFRGGTVGCAVYTKQPHRAKPACWAICVLTLPAVTPR